MATRIVYGPSSGTDITANLDAVLTTLSPYDEVLIANGTWDYTGQRSITQKGIKLKSLIPITSTWDGYNVNFSSFPATVLKRPESMSDASLEGKHMIRFVQTTTDDCDIEVFDIEFRSKLPSFTGAPTADPPQAATDGLSLAVDFGLKFEKCVNFKVARCIFKYFGDAAISVFHFDNKADGLIYRCYFYSNAKGWDGCGAGYGIGVRGEDNTYVTDPQYGSSNFVFIEDCRGDYHRHWIASGGAGKYVVRNSYDYENAVSIDRVTQSFDSHSPRKEDAGLGSGNYYGTRAFEAYNNKVIHDRFWDNDRNGDIITPGLGGAGASQLIEFGAACRGGSCLVHHNEFVGVQFAVGLYLENADTDATYAPTATDPMHVWSNTFSRYTTASAGSYPYSYFFLNINDGVINPTSYPHHFDSGVHYFASEDDSAAKPGYTTYTYPHPLRDDLIITPPVGTGLRTFKTRTFKTR